MDRRIYPDDLAARFKARAGEKYRPSNGDEGMAFMDRWCDRCQKDAAFQSGAGDGCPIAAVTFIYQVDDPKYPTEWQYGEDGQPKCTAFVATETA